MQLAGLSIDRGIAGRWGPAKGEGDGGGKGQRSRSCRAALTLAWDGNRQSYGTFCIVTYDYLRGAGRFDLDLISLSATQPWLDRNHCGTCLMN